jgi:hypothetical protein
VAFRLRYYTLSSHQYVSLTSQSPLHVELSFLDHKLPTTSKSFKINMKEPHTSPIKSENRLSEPL